MRAQILSIGDELLGGYITDTNSTFLEQQLALLNIPVTLVTQVGDNRDRIAEVIAKALTDVDIVVCTGGVGPTEDDHDPRGDLPGAGRTTGNRLRPARNNPELLLRSRPRNARTQPEAGIGDSL